MIGASSTSASVGLRRRWPSLVPIVVGNGVPLVGVLLLGWSVYAVVTAFWLEALAVGIVTTVEIAQVARDDLPTDDGTVGRFVVTHGAGRGGGGADQIYIPPSGDRRAPEDLQAILADYGSGWSRFYRVQHAVVFLVGFLICWTVVGLAVNLALGPASDPHGRWVLFPLAWPTVMGGIAAVWVVLWLGTQLVTHGAAYRREFIRTGAWKRLRPSDVSIDAEWHLTVLAAVTVFPAIVAGPHLSFSTAALLLLIASKIAADVGKWWRLGHKTRAVENQV